MIDAYISDKQLTQQIDALQLVLEQRQTARAKRLLCDPFAYNELGQAVAAARDDLGWSQTELATQANVHHSTVSHIETGKRLKIETAIKLLAVMGKRLELKIV